MTVSVGGVLVSNNMGSLFDTDTTSPTWSSFHCIVNEQLVKFAVERAALLFPLAKGTCWQLQRIEIYAFGLHRIKIKPNWPRDCINLLSLNFWKYWVCFVMHWTNSPLQDVCFIRFRDRGTLKLFYFGSDFPRSALQHKRSWSISRFWGFTRLSWIIKKQ